MNYTHFDRFITKLPYTETALQYRNLPLDPSKDKNGYIRFDFVFSYWIYVWFLLYWFVPKTKPSKSSTTHFIYEWMNPMVFFFIGFGENAFTLALLWYYTNNTTILFKYTAMMFFVKLLPIIILWNRPIHWFVNLVIGSIAFILYNVYLAWNGTNIVDVYSRTFTSLLEDKDQTPLYSFTKAAIAFFTSKSPDAKPDFARLWR